MACIPFVLCHLDVAQSTPSVVYVQQRGLYFTTHRRSAGVWYSNRLFVGNDVTSLTEVFFRGMSSLQLLWVHLKSAWYPVDSNMILVRTTHRRESYRIPGPMRVLFEATGILFVQHANRQNAIGSPIPQ